MVKGVPLTYWTGLERRVVCVESLSVISIDVPVGNVMADVSAVCVAVIIHTLTLSPLCSD